MATTTLILFLFIGIIGAAVGSFITLLTYRLPLDEPIGMTRSRCPKCQTPLAVRDLFPILSYVLNHGQCRHCKTKVSIRYPLTELFSAVGAVAVFAHYGFTWEAVAITGLWWCIVAMFVTDLEHQIILDEVQIAAAILGVFAGVITNVPLADMAAGAFVGAAIGLGLKYGFIYFRNKDGLGLGDVKFLAVAGIWLADGANFVPFLFFSGVLGILSALVWRAMGHGERFPFGPALAIALLGCVVVPEVANDFWKLYGLLR